jgi:hypothetical protein
LVERTWWAHFEFTCINIEPTILRKKIEELRVFRASCCCAHRASSLHVARSLATGERAARALGEIDTPTRIVS